VLVNNAANDQRHKTLEIDESYWDWSTSINMKAYFFACQAAIARMRNAGGGTIVNFSSISYMMGNGGMPAYTSSNAAITSLTATLAREFGPEKIRLNALAPGWVLTDKQMEKWASDEALAEHMARQCLKEHLVPEDIVGGTLFLASNASRMMTGQCLVIDGGVVVPG
jgi:NAD(P)-dependent dehydrogenase (short-subunit alcohol dehydrogenase family)